MSGKNPTLVELGLDLDALRKYEVDLRAGTVSTDGTKADHDAAMAAELALMRAAKSESTTEPSPPKHRRIRMRLH